MTHRHEILPLESVATTESGSTRDPRDEAPVSEPRVAPAAREPGGPAEAKDGLANQAVEHWKSIQGKFVDDPRGSVSDARALVDNVIRRTLQSLTEQRESLDQQWSEDPAASTEQLRLCLQQYRALFTRILPIIPSGSSEMPGPQR